MDNSKVLILSDENGPTVDCKAEVQVDLDPMTQEASLVKEAQADFTKDNIFGNGTGNATVGTIIIDQTENVSVSAPVIPSNSSIASAKMIFCTNTDNNGLNGNNFFQNELITFNYIHPTNGTTESTVVGNSTFPPGSTPPFTVVPDCQEYCIEVDILSTELSSVSGSVISNITAQVSSGGVFQNLCAENSVRVSYIVDYVDNNQIFASAPFDNCSPDNALSVSFNMTQTDFDCTDLNPMSTITAEFIVTDAAGKTSETCTSDIIVDNPPMAIAIDAGLIQIQFFDVNGNYTLDPALVDGGSGAACENGILTISPTTFDCSNAGVNEITLRYELPNGEFSEATTEITIEADPAFPDPCDPCPDVVFIDNIPVLNGVYDSGNIINSTGLIEGANMSTDIIYNAENEINLNPFFEVRVGATFEANIQDCDDGL